MSLLSLFSGLNGYLLGAGAILVAFIGTYLKGRVSGAARERERNAAKERDAYEQELEDLATANIARNGVDGRVPERDKYRRD
jgi:hypothetical protein